MISPLNPQSAKRLFSIPWDAGYVTAVAFLGSARKVAAGNGLGDILIWDLPENPEKDPPSPSRWLKGHTGQVTALAATPDGRWLISASYDHTIRLWDMNAAAEATVDIVMEPKQQARKRVNGKPVENPPALKVEQVTKARVLDVHKDWVRGLALAADGTRLLTGDDRGLAVLWEIPEGKELRRWQVPGWLQGVALSVDSKRAVTCEHANRYAQFKDAVKLWDLTTGELMLDATKSCSAAQVAALSPDGALLAAGQGGENDGARIQLVEAATGKKLREWAGHKYGVTGILFHPDGKHLLSCGRDTTVRVWQVSDGKQVAALGKPRGGQFTDFIYALALAPDQQTLATADMGGLVEVWTFPT
jgi:WD40 repeat protein